MAAGPDESDRRPLDAIALDALAELRRLFQADAPSTAASEEAAGELLAAAGRIARAARTDAAPFEPIDAIEALVRAQAPPLEPLAFSLDGLRQPGAAEPGRRASGAPAADGAGLRLPASDLLSAAAEQKGMSEEELVAYLEAIGPTPALTAGAARGLVFTLDQGVGARPPRPPSPPIATHDAPSSPTCGLPKSSSPRAASHRATGESTARADDGTARAVRDQRHPPPPSSVTARPRDTRPDFRVLRSPGTPIWKTRAPGRCSSAGLGDQRIRNACGRGSESLQGAPFL